MKHGISPTTPRHVDTSRYAHISAPLAYRSGGWRVCPDDVDVLIFQPIAFHSVFLPLPPDIGPVTTVRAPVKGKTYRRENPNVRQTRQVKRRRKAADRHDIQMERLSA